VLFVVDIKGGGGKSTLCKWMLHNHKTWACQGGKTADLMQAYDQDCRFAVFDMAKCTNTEWWPWNFIENIKNGWFTKTKYRGGMCTFEAPKVLVLTNEEVNKDKLSADRYQVIKISE